MKKLSIASVLLLGAGMAVAQAGGSGAGAGAGAAGTGATGGVTGQSFVVPDPDIPVLARIRANLARYF